MIKIGPLIATDYKQICSLLELEEGPNIANSLLSGKDVLLSSLTFWQHWLPCRYHLGQSIYVAKEEGMVLGFISLASAGKSSLCWRIENLAVHPEHRGRGIAQELLRYAFAQFGSQGVSHFIAEVGCGNEPALALFAHGGFRRSARVSYFLLNRRRASAAVDVQAPFRPATNSCRNRLFQLYQDALPPDLRLVLEQVADDYKVAEKLPFTSVEKRRGKLMRRRAWYWISEDADRRVLTSAVKVIAEPSIGYRLEFAVHPGWKQLSGALVQFAVAELLNDAPEVAIWAKVYDFAPEIEEAVEQVGFERTGEFFLLAREHWQRARHRRRPVDQAVALPGIATPAINLPLAAERAAAAFADRLPRMVLLKSIATIRKQARELP